MQEVTLGLLEAALVSDGVLVADGERVAEELGSGELEVDGVVLGEREPDVEAVGDALTSALRLPVDEPVFALLVEGVTEGETLLDAERVCGAVAD